MSITDASCYPPVLVVDDEPDVARVLSMMIEARGYRVQTCGGAMEALEILDGWSKGIVLADLSMPGLDGLALCRALRDASRTWTPIFILMTGHSCSPAFIEAAFEQGIDDFIPKPVSREELFGRMRAARRLASVEEDIRIRAELEIERRLHQAGVEELNEIVSILAHDLRTPIAALRTTAEMLVWNASGDPRIKAGLDRMVKLAVHMSETVRDVADAFHCEDADELRESWRALDLAELCRQTVDLVGAKEGVEVVVDESPGTGVGMTGNPSGIRRLVLNLLTNALRATTSGSIRIATGFADPEHAFLEIRDTGPGIPLELLPHLGEPMMLSSGARRRERSIHGAGLGIAICRRVVANHGGRMFVETSPGRGTRVVVHLCRNLSDPVLGSGQCPLDREVQE